jgi:lysophospholipase L1-like esterase
MRHVVSIMLLAGLLGAQVGSAAEFFFKNGDTVCVIGDSITEHAHYVNIMEMWTLTRFPGWDIRFRNVGKGSDTAPGGAARFQECVVPVKPTVLTVDFGMNDAKYRAFDENIFAVYTNGLQSIADQAKKENIRVAWITPQPVERDLKDKSRGDCPIYNETLGEFAKRLKPFAEANNGLYIDQFTPYLAVLEKARATDPMIRITGGDWIHPGQPGGLLMAANILKGMSFPILVSAAEIDGLKVVKAVQCEINDLKAGPTGGIQFKRLDAALPYFPDPVVGKPRGSPPASEMLKWAPILEEMNDYRLKVAGLKPGNYEVRLDGEKIVEYSSEQLAGGVNLAGPALANGPIAKQVHQVIEAVMAKNGYFHGQIFRGIMDYKPREFPSFVKDGKALLEEVLKQKRLALVKRLTELPKYDEAVRKTLVMQPHLVEIVPVTK